MKWVDKKNMRIILKIFNLDDSFESVFNNKILLVFLLNAFCYIKIEKTFSLVFIDCTKKTIIKN